MTDLMTVCRSIGLAAKLNAREVETLAMAAIENAGDVAESEQLVCAVSTMQSYVNGDTRGTDLDYMLEYCKPRSRAAAKLIRTALSQKPDAIVGPNWVPEAMDAAFKEVVAAGVPLIIYNAGGMDAAKRLGAQNYVGSDEYVAGSGGGEYFASKGSKNVLCVNTQPGSTNQESRCKGLADGMAKGGGKGTQLPLPTQSP